MIINCLACLSSVPSCSDFAHSYNPCMHRQKNLCEDEGHFLTVQNATEEYTTQILSLIDTICLAYLLSPFWYFTSSKINEACKRPCEIYFLPRKKLLDNNGIQNSILKQLNQKKRDKSMLFLQYLFITVKSLKKKKQVLTIPNSLKYKLNSSACESLSLNTGQDAL